MRILSPAFALILPAAALAACATTGGGETYQQEFARLEASCQQRGGMLVAASAPSSGRPSTDYVCDIRDGGRLAADRADRD